MGVKKRKAKQQEKADQAEQLQTMGEAAGAYSARRPLTQQALNASLQQQLAAFQGLNTLLGQMGLPGLPSSEGFGNIITPELLAVGRTSQDPNLPSGEPAPEGSAEGGSEKLSTSDYFGRNKQDRFKSGGEKRREQRRGKR